MLSPSIPLRVSHIVKSYGTHRVLDGISFELRAGEIFGLVGLNGIGKTTLIKTLLDLTQADSGNAEMFGIPCTHVQAREKLSYLPEKFTPSRYLRGDEYLKLALAYYGKPYDHAHARALAE